MKGGTGIAQACSLSPFSSAGALLADDRDALKNRVREANDIVDVVGGYVALRPAGQTYKGLCPFHDDRRPSFDVDPRRQRFRCWSCGKTGDVFTFIQEHDRVDFREALAILARRAGIPLDRRDSSERDTGRTVMLDVMAWATEQFHRCLLDEPEGESARLYLGERGLTGETVRRFRLGYAPLTGDWLIRQAAPAGKSAEILEQVGLIGKRQQGPGHYDRFRDRVMFPIRDARGQTVGFGGRILPQSPLLSRAPKYYNSSDTPLFTKSEHLYGLDLARQAGVAAGYLAVVEGYTDVLMAHQAGISEVVATMGTALNARHVRQLRRLVPRVVLVFDADAGGETGVDRALEIFASHDVDLAVATLPAGMDPCDFLRAHGPGPFREALTRAVDALEFKMNQALAQPDADSVPGRIRAVDAVLGVLALAPEMPGQAGAVKRELMMTRVAQRLGVREETAWARLGELRARRRATPAVQRATAEQKAPAPARERELLQVLLGEPNLVARAAAEVKPQELEHPGLRRVLEGLYALEAEGATPDLEHLRTRLEDPRLAAFMEREQEIGRANPQRGAWLDRLLAEFRQRRLLPEKQQIQDRLQSASDHTEAVELLRRLQQQTDDLQPGVSSVAGAGQ